jgi:hypothetical protein
MYKNYYTDYTQDGYPIKELESKYGTPPFIKCDICGNSGECMNSEKSIKYDKEFSDYLDCMNYLKTISDKNY